MRKIIKLSGVVLSILLLAGCVAEPEVKLDVPGKVITKAETSYSTVLRRTNDMINVFVGEPMNIIDINIHRFTHKYIYHVICSS